MKIDVEENARYTSLALSGDMTIYHTAELKAQLLPYLMRVRELELDLSQISQLDSSGIQLLMLIKREFTSDARILRLVSHSRAVLDVFELYNLAAYFGDPLLISGSGNTSGRNIS